jgi:hypothetical protein
MQLRVLNVGKHEYESEKRHIPKIKTGIRIINEDLAVFVTYYCLLTINFKKIPTES